jgi:hypothetical protein
MVCNEKRRSDSAEIILYSGNRKIDTKNLIELGGRRGHADREGL